MTYARTPHIILRAVIILLVGGVVLGYAYYRTLPYRLGPSVTLDAPSSVIHTNTPLVEVAGHTERISDIHLNGRKIFTDTDGKFTEQVYVHPGYNIITIKASDRFEKVITRDVEVLYSPTSHN